MLRSFLFCFVFAIFASLVACQCATGRFEEPDGDAKIDDPDPGDDASCRRGQVACTIGGETQCVSYDPADLCEPWERCVSGSTTCDASGTPVCTCEVAEALGAGTQVAFADSTQLANGALIVAGWNAGLAPHAYKDLNVGWWNPAAEHDTCSNGAIEWEIVRGVPEGEGPIADPDGYRGGVAATGPNVGRFASIITVPDEDGAPSNDVLVSYEVVSEEGAFVEIAHGRFIGEDASNVAFDWSFHAVEPPAGAVAVASTSLTLQSNGMPAVAYTLHYPSRPGDADDPRNQPTYEIKVARATVAVPEAAEDWTVINVVDATDAGCQNDSQCADGQRCIRAGFFGMCLETADLTNCVGTEGESAGEVVCDPGAGGPIASPAELCVAVDTIKADLPENNYLGDSDYDRDAFIDGVCPETGVGTGHCCMLPMKLGDYIPVNGLFLSLNSVGNDGQLSLLSYGRRTGTLDHYSINPENQVTHRVVRGGGAEGDVGMGLSATLDPANNRLLHVAFVDGIKNDLYYLRLNVNANGNVVVAANSLRVVDDGNPIAGLEARATPGFVGDNSRIAIAQTETGAEARIVYSDTANHQTVLARRAAGANSGTAFEISVIENHLKEGNAGAIGDGNFPTILNNNDVAHPGSSLITSTYRLTVGSRAKSDTCVAPFGMAEVEDGEEEGAGD